MDSQNIYSMSRRLKFQNFQDSSILLDELFKKEQIKHYTKWYNMNGIVTIDLRNP
ncbi:unnamed protein product [Paramecium sonneborni]|uniref:Uncharacterized protein n=1 Tax=Paramecium sonneborni TaxID=65129 RepID=A0A8S1QUA3_9CILI|nr:unnamed protein product [Paramecium sonneborni]